MTKGEEVVRVLGGREVRLIPLSGADYVRAARESGQALKEIQTIHEAEDGMGGLLLRSSLLARGAYDGEERAFSGWQQVMETLSGQEILDGGEEYMHLFHQMAVKSCKEDGPAEEKEKQTEGVGGRESRRQRQRREETIWLRKPGQESARGEEETLEGIPVLRRQEMSRNSMQAVSDYFERDARRYPGAFLGYMEGLE